MISGTALELEGRLAGIWAMLTKTQLVSDVADAIQPWLGADWDSALPGFDTVLSLTVRPRK